MKAPGDLEQVDTWDVEVLPGLRRTQFTGRDSVSRWDVVQAYHPGDQSLLRSVRGLPQGPRSVRFRLREAVRSWRSVKQNVNLRRWVKIWHIGRDSRKAQPPAGLVSPDPGLGAGPVLFQTEKGVYRVRTVPAGQEREGKIILLEPLPAEQDLCRKLSGSHLTKRQEESAVMVIRGHLNREIAEQLFLCEQTV